jgi:hypothetical protein
LSRPVMLNRSLNCGLGVVLRPYGKYRYPRKRVPRYLYRPSALIIEDIGYYRR